MTPSSGQLADSDLLLGIDVGGTKTALVVGTTEGTVLDRCQFASDAARGYQAMLEDIRDNAKALINAHPTIKAIGAVAGGPLDAERGLVLAPPHLPGWDGVPFADDLGELGLPVRIEHDAKAGALAEWLFGAGRGCTDLVFLTLGTGIGAGIIANGQLLRGAGNAAGEIGHWRLRKTGPDFYGKRGALEGLASGAGVAAFAREHYPETLGELRDARELAERAERGEVEARQAIAAAGEVLGEALALIIDLLAPQRVVLGSLARRLGQRFTGPMHDVVVRETLASTLANCRIVDGELGDRIGDLGALSVALEALKSQNNNKQD